MANAPKTKFISKNDQEQLVQDFYNNLGDDEDTFLRHHFVESDVNDDSDFSDDESDRVPKQKSIENDGEKKDNDDGEIEEIVCDDNNNVQIESVVDEADDAQCLQNYPKSKNSKILRRFWMKIVTLIYWLKE